MPIIEKTIRFAAIALAVLFIGLSLFGIFGAWFVDRKATDVALKVFGFIETGVGVVDAGVGRVDDLIATSRTEVRQAAETITAVGAQAQANSPVLNALNERLETSLAPRIAQMQQVLAPVRDAVGTVGNAVSLLNSLPMMADRAPRLAALDETFNRLEELSADATQLRSTLRALVVEQNSDITAETVATLNGLTQRIDTRLGEVQANVQGVQSGHRGVAGPAGQAQVAAAVRFQSAGAAVDADAGLDPLQPGCRHPAPLGPCAAARGQTAHQRQQGLLHRHASDVSDHVASPPSEPVRLPGAVAGGCGRARRAAKPLGNRDPPPSDRIPRQVWSVLFLADKIPRCPAKFICVSFYPSTRTIERSQ